MAFNQKILSTLSQLKSSGSYMAAGSRDFILPGLAIMGADELSFPLKPIQIQDLIKIAHKAPFGKGSQTVLDSNVRSAWEIDADQIKFNNPKWQTFLEGILAETKAALGIEGQDIRANLYKMLIYEAGDFFLAHKDSEKEKGMFGTLIVGLPSQHSGGELLIDFEGESSTVDFSASAHHDIPYCAFYADCTHEIKPLTSGYRVVVVYNLIQATGQEKLKLEPKKELVASLVRLLNGYKNTIESPQVILLGHQYTEANFSQDGLKGNDKTKAEALLAAAEKAGYYAKMGLLTSYVSGELESDNDYSYRGRRYYDEDDYDDDDEVSGSMGEIYEAYIDVQHWAKDALPGLMGLQLEDGQLIKNFDLNDGEPDEQASEGYTGNAGMTIDYWYHYGAVFLWPKMNHVKILTQETNYHCSLAWLEYYTKNWASITADEQLMAQKIAGKLCPPETNYSRHKDNHNAIVDLLILKKDPAYVEFKGVMMLKKCILAIEASKFALLFDQYEAKLFDDLFSTAFISNNERILEKVLSILQVLAKSDQKTSAAFVQQQMANLPSLLKGFDCSALNESVAKSIISNCIHLCQNPNHEALLQPISTLLTLVLNRNYTNNVLVALIFQQELAHYPLAIELLKHAQKDIQKRVDAKPQPPKDWARKVPTNVYHKDVWALLNNFLESPTEQEFLYKSLQADRINMEKAIDSVKIDLDTETIKKGSPHTLKLTKNQAEYQRALAIWQEDVNLLARIKNS
jgi:hypothetical protein